jgi:AcrR family transcriptional regulator
MKKLSESETEADRMAREKYWDKADEEGRGSSPRSEGPQRRLLSAAREAFATKGYEAATIRHITEAAAVNIGAVNYHFGSKEDLYHAVLFSMVGPLGHRVRWAAHARVPALEKVERIVRAIFEHIRTNPDMPAVITRELASGRELAGPIRKVFGELLPVLSAVIADGQKDGTIRAGDPVLLALSTVAQPVYLNLARPIITTVAGVDPQDERVVEHAVATVRAALEKRP